jgi:hypothetical protein
VALRAVLVASKQKWSTTTMTTQQIIAEIAKKHLRIETLKEQKSDRLDFHEVGVWSIEAALLAAFEAGQRHCGPVGPSN